MRSLTQLYAYAAAEEAISQAMIPTSTLALLAETCLFSNSFLSVFSATLGSELGIGASSELKISPLGSLDGVCSALSKIYSGSHNAVVLVGSQQSLSPFFISNLNSFGILNDKDNGNPQGAIKSFDIDAKGIVLGEGAAAIVFENWESALKRNAYILAEVGGYTRSNDAKYLFKPDLYGDGLKSNLEKTMKHNKGDVDVVLADGSSIPERDFAEASAIRKISAAKITSLKPSLGHLLGALGSTQLAAGVLCIANVNFI